MPIDFRSTTSNPGFGTAPLPSSQVGSYVNQQVVGARNRAAEAQRNQFVRTPQFQRQESATVKFDQPNTVMKTAKNIGDTNKKLFDSAIQQRNTRRAADRAAQNVQAPGQNVGAKGYNTYSVPAGVTGNRAQALNSAASYLGTRYVLGGRGKGGIDCSGLVMTVYNQLGFNITRHSATWQRDNIPGVRTNDLNQLRPGDIVAWRDGSHIAVYAGNGEIIEAANPRVGTVRRRLWANPSAVVGIKLRFPGE